LTAGKTAKPPRKAPPKKAGAARGRSRAADGRRELQKLIKAELYQRATELDCRPLEAEPARQRDGPAPAGG
jgi:DNA end-binding protein Ku